jgi:hypothetical protein
VSRGIAVFGEAAKLLSDQVRVALAIAAMRFIVVLFAASCMLLSYCDAADLKIKTTFKPKKCDRKAKAGDRVRPAAREYLRAEISYFIFGTQVQKKLHEA